MDPFVEQLTRLGARHPTRSKWPAMPAIATPRSIDLAHLRTAMRVHTEQPISRFVTMDTVQAQAARELALPV